MSKPKWENYKITNYNAYHNINDLNDNYYIIFNCFKFKFNFFLNIDQLPVLEK